MPPWMELIAVGLEHAAWPLAAVACVVSMLLSPRLEKVLERLVEIDTPAGKARFGEQSVPSREGLEIPPLAEGPYRELMEMAEQETKTEADRLVRDHKIDRESSLVRMVAEVRSALTLERIYNTIFGSQIEALQKLLSHGGAVDIKALESVHADAVARFPKLHGPNYPFASWIRYMLETGLIEVVGNQVRITPLGKAFVPYITHWNYRRPIG